MLKKEESPQAAPAWIVTYADFVTLFLCFFVVLVSMSEIRPERFHRAADSLQRAFGGLGSDAGPVPIQGTSGNELIERLLAMDGAGSGKREGNPKGQSTDESSLQVANDPSGIRIVIGGPITVDRSGATPRPEVRERIAEVARILAGSTARLVIRGHATRDGLPPGTINSDVRDLSYARAAAVALELERSGVHGNRMILVAAGDTEPLAEPSRTEDRRAVNDRVEIVVTEDLSNEAGVRGSAAESQESSGGR